MNNKDKKLYVLSDFHGCMEGLNKAIEALEHNRRVIILGDTVDRGKDGLKMLFKIKYLNENGYDIEYLPGNHDDMLYHILHKAKDYFIEDNESNDEYVQLVNRLTKGEMKLQSLNGVYYTYTDLINLVNRNPGAVYSLYEWLGNQKLELIEEENGIKYAFGHAAFDMDLYENSIKLKDTYGENASPQIIKKTLAVLWYRENKEEYQKCLRLPTKEEADYIVIGHTPFKLDTKLVGKNLTREAIGIDGGLIFNTSNSYDYMTVFNPSCGGRVYTKINKNMEIEK